MEFIDTHCDVFTGEDENKFEHRCHHVLIAVCFVFSQAASQHAASGLRRALHFIDREFPARNWNQSRGIRCRYPLCGSSSAISYTYLFVPVACEEGIKRGGAEAAVFSQIIAADDFLTFKRMMHARSASLDFQAHLQYEKIRSAVLPGTAAAAMEMCGQQVVSRNHEHHQQLIQQHQLQQSQQSGSCVAPPASSPPRNPYAAHSADSDESQDDDERMLQQAIGDSKFSMFECSIRIFAFSPCLQSYQSWLLKKCGLKFSRRRMTSRLPFA